MKKLVSALLVLAVLIVCCSCSATNQKDKNTEQTEEELAKGADDVYISGTVTNTTSYLYDVNGVATQNNLMLEYRYDNNGNVVYQMSDYNDSEQSVEYSYDQNGRIISIKYTNNGEIEKMTFKYVVRTLTEPIWDHVCNEIAFKYYDFPNTVFEAIPVTVGEGETWESESPLEYWQYVYDENNKLIASIDPIMNRAVYFNYYSDGAIKNSMTISSALVTIIEKDSYGNTLRQKQIVGETGEIFMDIINTYEEGNCIATVTTGYHNFSSETGVSDPFSSRYDYTYEDGAIKSVVITEDSVTKEYNFDFEKEENSIHTYVAKDGEGNLIFRKAYDELNRMVLSEEYQNGVISAQESFSYYEDTRLELKKEIKQYFENGNIQTQTIIENTFNKE